MLLGWKLREIIKRKRIHGNKKKAFIRRLSAIF
jgi:hypothetical protein